MRKRYIARVTRLGTGLAIIFPVQVCREFDIQRGVYFEFRALDTDDLRLLRVPDPQPALAYKKESPNE